MSKFFTFPLALLLASAFGTLAYGEVKPEAPPLPVASDSGPAVSRELPGPLQGGRFTPLGKKSPFTLASATEETADFAKDLFLGSYFRVDGQDFVIVANRTSPERLTIGTKAAAGDKGFSLVRIVRDPSGDPSKLQAQIRKGGETALLKYEVVSPATPAVPPASVPPGVAPVFPGQAPLGQAPVPGQAQPGQPNPNQNPAPINSPARRRSSPIPTLPKSS